MIYDRELREKYHIVSSLGRGTQEEFFLAEDVDETEYLLKVYNAEVPKKKVEREISLLLYVDHPSILQLKDFGELQDQRSYTVTNYMKYGSLANPKIFPLLTMEDKIRLFWEVAEGLSYLHKKDIIHRNIKPENIFLKKNGERYRACLGGFELAKHLQDPKITKSKEGLAGAELFIPTDVLAQEKPKLSKTTDLYALGVSMYVTFTDVFPYGKYLRDVIAQVTKPTAALPMSEYVSHIPKALDNLCCKMIQHNTEDRLASIEECKETLEQILNTRKSYDPEKVALPGPPKFLQVPQEKATVFKHQRLSESDLNELLSKVPANTMEEPNSADKLLSKNEIHEILAEVPIEKPIPKDKVLSASELNDLLADVSLAASDKKMMKEPLPDNLLPETIARLEKEKLLLPKVPKISPNLQKKYRNKKKTREKSKVQRIIYTYVGGTIAIHLLIQLAYEVFWR